MNEQEQQQEMDKKIKKLKLLLPLLVLLFGLVCVAISQVFPSKDEGKKNVASQGETQGEPFHASYSPDTNKEPFTQNTSSTTIHNITFLKPTNVSKKLLQENTNAFLTDDGENMMLFRAYGGVAYIYNKIDDTRFVVGNDIPKATLCTNPNYLAYISEHEFRTPKIIPYEVGLGNAQALYTAPYNHKITSIACDNQHVYFTVETPEGKKSTQVALLQEFQGKILPSETPQSVHNSSDFIVKNANGVYVYLPGENKFHLMKLHGNNNQDISVHVQDSVSRFLQMKLNDNGDYLAVYYDQELLLKGTINGEVLDGFLNLAMAEWYDEHHVLLLDTNTLYLYNAETKQKEVLKTDVSDFVVSNQDLFFHNAIGELYYMQRKTEE